MIRGISVILQDRVRTGTDAFNRPLYSEEPVTVKNVLVYPAAAEDVISEQNLSGKHLEYYLCVPKGDAHVWTDRNVTFYGQTWKVYGYPEEWIDENNPSTWNKRYKCERYSK